MPGARPRRRPRTPPQVGAIDGIPGPPTDARGPGNSGIGTRTGPDRGLGEGPGPGIGDGPYGVGNGVTGPELIVRTPPQYSAEAMRAKLQGVAVLSGVVGVDGKLHDIRVVRSLDPAFGLDREAIACVKQWRFRPGTRYGKPVAVYVTIEVAFNLRCAVKDPGTPSQSSAAADALAADDFLGIGSWACLGSWRLVVGS